MRNLAILSFLLTLSILAVGCEKEYRMTDEDRILTLEDRRAPADSLYPFLSHVDEAVQTRALLALSRLQDTLSIETIVPFLQNPSPAVRRMAFFALGQIGSAAAEPPVLAALESEKDVAARVQAIHAIGRIGTGKSFVILGRQLKSADSEVLSCVGIASAVMALRKVTDPAHTKKISGFLDHPNPDVRWSAVYGMMRILQDTRNSEYYDALVPLLKDPDARIRMDAARAMAFVIDVKKPDWLKKVEPVSTVSIADPDWRVRVNALNTLGNFKFPWKVNNALYGEIASGKLQPDHVRFAAMNNFANSYNGDLTRQKDIDEFLEFFENRVAANQGPDEIATSLIAFSRMFGEKILNYQPLWDLLLENNPSNRVRSKIAQALGQTRSVKAIPMLKKLMETESLLVKESVIQALGNIDTREAREMILQSLAINDMVVTAIAASILKDNKEFAEKAVEPLIQSYQALKPPVDVESKQVIIEALGEMKDERAVPLLESVLSDSEHVVRGYAADALKNITGNDYSDRIGEKMPNKPLDFEFINKMRTSANLKAVIHTEIGNIELLLFPDEAPLTCMNFVLLAKKGFYDGIIFHRVVPNFVIQAGDPRGDGWGGPGYSIRSEFNLFEYKEGTVGMASAGKDTEGSQFFVTHSPAPHLNGRYTIFARVTEGMKTVESILEGSKIQTIEIVGMD